MLSIIMACTVAYLLAVVFDCSTNLPVGQLHQIFSAGHIGSVHVRQIFSVNLRLLLCSLHPYVECHLQSSSPENAQPHSDFHTAQAD